MPFADLAESYRPNHPAGFAVGRVAAGPSQDVAELHLQRILAQPSSRGEIQAVAHQPDGSRTYTLRLTGQSYADPGILWPMDVLGTRARMLVRVLKDEATGRGVRTAHVNIAPKLAHEPHALLYDPNGLNGPVWWDIQSFSDAVEDVKNSTARRGTARFCKSDPGSTRRTHVSGLPPITFEAADALQPIVAAQFEGDPNFVGTAVTHAPLDRGGFAVEVLHSCIEAARRTLRLPPGSGPVVFVHAEQPVPYTAGAGSDADGLYFDEVEEAARGAVRPGRNGRFPIWSWPGDLRRHVTGGVHQISPEQAAHAPVTELVRWHDRWHEKHGPR